VGAAFRAGMTLSDDPYATLAPASVSGNDVSVPDVGISRVVETPAEIVGQIDRYVAYDGRLDPSTAGVAGYDFLTDGSQAVADRLEATASVERLLSPAWNATDLLDLMLPAGGRAPDLLSVNAHFDHRTILTAVGDAQGYGAAGGLLGAEEVAQRAGPDGFEGTLVFSMGCHAGLSVSDIALSGPELSEGLGQDWAQTITSRGGLYAGSTGYGYGDRERIAFTEELMARFARRLDGSAPNVGIALAAAKQSYFGRLLTPGVYDAKVLQQTTLYGLPTWRVLGPATPPPPAPTVTTEPGPGAEDTFSVEVTPTLSAQVTDSGVVYTDPIGETVESPGRPVVPVLATDVTPTDGALVPRGVVVEGLESVDVADVDPVVVRPVPAASATELAEPLPVTFPDELGALRPEGDRETLLLAPAQFRAANGGPRGTMRLFGRIRARVVYGPRASADEAPPQITQVRVEGGAGLVTVRVRAQDASAITRVNVVYLDGGVWRVVEAVPDGPGEWTATGPATATEVEALAQVQDAAGWVASSTAKGELHQATPPADVTPPQTRITSAPPATTPLTTARLEFDADEPFSTFECSLDGAPFTPCASPVLYSGLQPGPHTFAVRATDANGNPDPTPAEAAWSVVDESPPVVTITSGPPEFTRETEATVAFTSDTPGATFSCALDAADPAPCTSPYTVSGLGEGPHTVRVVAVASGGSSEPAVRSWTVDLTPPSVTITSPTAGQAFAFGATAAAGYTCTDSLSGVGSCTGPVASGGNLPTTDVGNTTFPVTATDRAGNGASASRAYSVGFPAGWKKLNLTSMCGMTTPTTLGWRVRNTNTNAGAYFRWDVYGTAQAGTGYVPPSTDVFFTTQRVPNSPNTTRLWVGNQLQSTKAACLS
jgi:hypothetical protein